MSKRATWKITGTAKFAGKDIMTFPTKVFEFIVSFQKMSTNVCLHFVLKIFEVSGNRWKNICKMFEDFDLLLRILNGWKIVAVAF